VPRPYLQAGRGVHTIIIDADETQDAWAARPRGAGHGFVSDEAKRIAKPLRESSRLEALKRDVSATGLAYQERARGPPGACGPREWIAQSGALVAFRPKRLRSKIADLDDLLRRAAARRQSVSRGIPGSASFRAEGKSVRPFGGRTVNPF
jgi:hypothetical protein